MATTETRSGLGLTYAWTLGENNWHTGMNANLNAIAYFGVHVSVKDRDLATPPGSPAAGDTYIVAGSPTGAWTGHATHLAAWDGAAWIFATPRTGWLAHVEDESKLCAFRSGAWSAGVSL